MASEEVKRKVRMYLDKSSENLRAFAKVAELTKDVPGLKKLEVKYLIQQARNIDLIQVRNNKVIWVTRDSDDVNREFKSLEELEKFFLKEQAAFKKGSNDLNFYSILQTELQERNIKLK
jgi:endo-1,4-beta-mannosidase